MASSLFVAHVLNNYDISGWESSSSVNYSSVSQPVVRGLVDAGPHILHVFLASYFLFSLISVSKSIT
jgi:hypothetical protein